MHEIRHSRRRDRPQSICRRCGRRWRADYRRLTTEAVRAGASGFATSRTNAHKTTKGEMVPGRFAEIHELSGIGSGLGPIGAGTNRNAKAPIRSRKTYFSIANGAT